MYQNNPAPNTSTSTIKMVLKRSAFCPLLILEAVSLAITACLLFSMFCAKKYIESMSFFPLKVPIILSAEFLPLIEKESNNFLLKFILLLTTVSKSSISFTVTESSATC